MIAKNFVQSISVLLLVLAIAFFKPGKLFAATLSLKQALLIAIDHSPDLDTARLNRSVTLLQVKSANAKFLPSVDLTSNHGLNKTYTPGGPTDPLGSQLNLALTENFYDNGESLVRYDISKLNDEIATLTFLRTREQLALDMGTQFYLLSQAQQLFDVKKQQIDILKKQLALVTNHYRQGMQTRTDYLRFATQVKRADIDARNAEVTVRQTELEIKRLMGIPSDEEVEFEILGEKQVPTSPPDDPPPLKQAYDYRIAKLQTDLNPLNVSLVKQKYWPQVLVTGAMTYSNFGYINSGTLFSENQQYGWSVLLGLNFNLLDWGIRKRDVEVAQAQALVQDNQLKKTELQLNADIKNLMITISQLKANDQLASELRQAEEETYRFIRSQYEDGKVTYLDLITSLNDTLDAKVQYLQAHYGLAVAWSKYHFYRTTLYDTVEK